MKPREINQEAIEEAKRVRLSQDWRYQNLVKEKNALEKRLIKVNKELKKIELE
jgi:hypothetical protein